MKPPKIRFNRDTILKDISAGVTGAVAGAPQAMGFALVGGVSPLYGLYASVFPTIVGGMMASTGVMTIAPTNVLMLLVAGMLASYDNPVPPIPLFTFTLLIGIIQLGFGFLRLGNLTQYVSNAVITGFISGAGILIMLGQIDLAAGFTIPTTSNAVGDFYTWLTRLPTDTNMNSIIVTMTTLGIVVALRNTKIKNYSVILGIVIASILPLVFGWDDVLTVKSMSEIPAGLPSPSLPDPQFARAIVSIAFATAVLASVQSAALAESIRQPDEPQPDINRDLVAQGVANMSGSFFQSLPAAGSLSRTAINQSAGATSRWSNIFAGVFIGALLIGAGPLIELIALPALAGNLIVAAVRLIKIDAIKLVWNVNWMARAAMIATFIATLTLPLEYSVYIGVVLSLALYIHTSTNDITIVRLVRNEDGQYSEIDMPETITDSEPLIVSIYGNLYFGSFKKLERLLPMPAEDSPYVIIRMRRVKSLGSTGLKILLRYNEQLQKFGGKLILTGVSEKLREELQRANAIEEFGEEALFDPSPIIFESMENGLAYANQLRDQPTPIEA